MRGSSGAPRTVERDAGEEVSRADVDHAVHRGPHAGAARGGQHVAHALRRLRAPVPAIAVHPGARVRGRRGRGLARGDRPRQQSRCAARGAPALLAVRRTARGPRGLLDAAADPRPGGRPALRALRRGGARGDCAAGSRRPGPARPPRGAAHALRVGADPRRARRGGVLRARPAGSPGLLLQPPARTVGGAAMLVEIVRGLLEHAHCRLGAHGSGGLLLATALAAVLEDHAQPSLGLTEVEAADPVSLAAMRMLAAHAGPDAVGAPDPGAPHLALLLSQRVEDPLAFVEQVESVLLDLGPQDAAVVVGPSELLVEAITDEHVREARDRLLLPTPEDPAPLRYAARLPKGLSRFGGRRRLAMWVFGTAVP